MCAVVRINVGGTRFETTAATLAGAPYVAALVSSELPVDCDAEGVCFVDREPTLFAAILKYLRTGKWRCPPNATPDELLREAQFYGVELVACDFTVAFLRQRFAVDQGLVGKGELFAQAADMISGKLASLVDGRGDLAFVVVPSIATLKEHASKTLLRTGIGQFESIDVDKLKVAFESEEGVSLWFQDDLYTTLSNISLETLVWYIHEHLHFTLHAEKGDMIFPYNVEYGVESTPNTPGKNHWPAAHAPVYSKLHGMLHTYREGHCEARGWWILQPQERKCYPVCDAYYFFWKPHVADRESEGGVHRLGDVTLCSTTDED